MEDFETGVSSALGDYVAARFREAKEVKSPVFEDLLDCLRLLKGDKLTCSIEDELDINVNITAPIIKNVVGLLRDVFASSVEAPFIIKPTPIADLSEDTVSRLREQLRRDLPMLVEQAGGDSDTLVSILKDIKQASMLYESSEANKAAEKMTTAVKDDLRDAGWLNQFGDFLHNFVTYRAAIMKTPVHKPKKWKQWDGYTMVPTTRTVRCVENVSPFDFYPAPYTTDIQTAEYVIERRTVTRGELMEYTRHPELEYSVEGIMEVLQQYPDGHHEMYEDGREERHGLEGYEQFRTGAKDTYTALGFYGRLRGNYLLEHGVDVPDELDTYEAVVWVIGGVVIQAILNPDELGKRPFYAASFEPIPGQFWGMCPTLRLKDIQRVCTATIINLVKNMAFAGGPLGEVDIERVDENEGDPRVVAPYTLKAVDGGLGQNVGPAYRFYKIDSHASELLAIFDKFLNYGYEVLGIPRLAFGSSQGLGEVGRTSGGLSMLMNQASKAIKFAMRVLEEYVIEPVVQDYIDHKLMYSTDRAIKGDIRAYARGVSGIVEQDEKRQGYQWALQSIVPMMQITDPQTGQPLIPPDAPLRLLYDLFKMNGTPTEGILPDYDLQAQIYSGVPKGTMESPVAQLDNRSGNAMGAIEAMNNPVG